MKSSEVVGSPVAFVENPSVLVFPFAKYTITSSGLAAHQPEVIAHFSGLCECRFYDCRTPQDSAPLWRRGAGLVFS